MRISNNILLTNLDGLENLIQIDYALHISSNIALTDFCGLENLFINGVGPSFYTVENNAYNPTQQDIIDGNCSL